MASLHVSNDEGVSWQELNKGYEITTLKKLSTEKLVCLTKDNNVYTMSKNTDTLFNITPPNNSVLFIAVLDGIIYIFNSKNQLLKSTDLGLTWNGIGTISSEYYVSDMQILNNRFHFSLANQYTKHLITKGLTDLTPTTIQTKASYNNGTFIPISNNRVLSLTSSLPAMVKIIP